MLSVGFRALFRREILRFVRRPKNTFMPPAITNVLYFAVFGVILGNRIDQIAGFDYILFIVPGLIVLGASRTPSRTPRSRSFTADGTSIFTKR